VSNFFVHTLSFNALYADTHAHTCTYTLHSTHMHIFLTPFCSSIVLHCVNSSFFRQPLPYWWIFRLFLIFFPSNNIVNNLRICLYDFFSVCLFANISLDTILEIGLLNQGTNAYSILLDGAKFSSIKFILFCILVINA
jgi:hypothetical protein